MRTRLFILICSAFAVVMGNAPLLHADTTWVAAGDVAGVWSPAGNPYVIYNGDIAVSWFDSLEIQPGVIVEFTGDYAFNVDGYLAAVGTSEDSIRFTSDPLINPAGWSGLRFLIADDSSRLSYCIFEYGRADGAGDHRYGGAVECYGTSPTIEHCTFQNNYSQLDGGAIYCRTLSSPAISDCDFRMNHAASGGALLARSNSNPELVRCRFIDNEAISGGALRFDIRNRSVISQCWFTSNSADSGGAIHIGSGSAIEIDNSVFARNNGAFGGAICSESSRSSIIYCTFSGNVGTAAHLYLWTDSSVVNSSIFAFGMGTGIVAALGNQTYLKNSCFYGATASEFQGAFPAGTGQLTRRNVNLDSCDFHSNIFSDPAFIDTAADNYGLTQASHCHGAADLSLPQTTDYYGDPRPLPVGTVLDIGAIESPLNATTAHIGAISGIWEPDTYSILGDVIVPADSTLTLLPGTELHFLGNYKLTVAGLLIANGTIEDSIYFLPDNDSDCFKGISIEPTAQAGSVFSFCVVTGTRNSSGIFTQRAGTTIENSSVRYNNIGNHSVYGGGVRVYAPNCVVRNCEIIGNEGNAGGGINCDGMATIIENCLISGNTSRNGGGVYLGGSQTINCEIIDNVALDYGGGMYIGAGNAVVSACNILHNSAQDRGAGLYIYGGSPQLDDCTIRGNNVGLPSYSGYGGGMYIYGSSARPQLTRCVVTENYATRWGGAIYSNYSSPLLINSTIADNSQNTAFNSAIFIYRGFLTARNCIIANNGGYQIRLAATTENVFEFNDFYTSAGDYVFLIVESPEVHDDLFTVNANADSCDRYYNTYQNPLFQNSSAGNYSLLMSSPAIDAGNPALGRDADGSLLDAGAIPYEQTINPEPFLYLTWPVLWDTLSVNAIEPFAFHIDSADAIIDSVVYTVYLSDGVDTSQLYSGPLDSVEIDLLAAGLSSDTDIRWWAEARLLPQNVTVDAVVPFWFYTESSAVLELQAPRNHSTLVLDSTITFNWELRPDTFANSNIQYELELFWDNEHRTISAGAQTELQIQPDVLGIELGDSVTWLATAIIPPSTIFKVSESFHFSVVDSIEGITYVSALPAKTALHPLFPNPFNSTTTIPLDLSRSMFVSLRIYNTLGQEVECLLDQVVAAGTYQISFNSRDLPSGLYFCRLITNDSAMTRKMLLIR